MMQCGKIEPPNDRMTGHTRCQKKDKRTDMYLLLNGPWKYGRVTEVGKLDGA